MDVIEAAINVPATGGGSPLAIKKLQSPPLISFLVSQDATTTHFHGNDCCSGRLDVSGQICHSTFVVHKEFQLAGEQDLVGEVQYVSQHFLGNQNYISAGTISNQGKTYFRITGGS